MRRQTSRWRASLALASAFHAALLVVSSQVTRQAPAPPPAAMTTRGEPLWLELVTQEGRPALERAPVPSPPRAPRELPPRVGPAGALAAKKPATLPAEPGVGEGSGAPSAPLPSEVTAPVGEPSGAEGSAPRLSLRDLGVGVDNNPFLGPPASPASQRQVLNQRLRHSLQSGLASHDQTLGLGPEGPAVAAVKSIVLASATTPNTNAVLRLRTDAAGRTVHVEVVEASNESDGWRRIAAELERALAGKRLRVPPGTGGVSMLLRVASRVQLPSGADPGLAVELFGQTVKEGEGDRSAKLKILTPEITIQQVEVPGTPGAKVPVLVPSFTIIGGGGDLADIGAVAQRVVTAYLVGMETHPAQ